MGQVEQKVGAHEAKDLTLLHEICQCQRAPYMNLHRNKQKPCHAVMTHLGFSLL